MTPRERAIESLNLLRQNAWKRNATYSQCFLDDMADIIEHAILADRQTLQSELTERLNNAHRNWLHNGIVAGQTQCGFLYNFHREIQSVFAQQSQPEAGKPHAFQGRSDRWCEICNQPDRAEIHKVLVDVAFQQSVIETECNRRILADRQALQSELEKRFTDPLDEYPTKESRKWAIINITRVIEIIQSVFAQQSQPEERPKIQGFQVKPERGAGIETIEPGRTFTITGWLTEAECSRRVLAEREACAKAAISWTSDYREVDICHKAADAIRARSNQPEEKPSLTPFDPSCSTCVREAKEEAEEDVKRVERMISSADRIATLQEWLATDAKIIQQLNESNNALSEKIAQLEKENHELQIKERERRETRSDWHTHFCDSPDCKTTACECSISHLSATRKA